MKTKKPVETMICIIDNHHGIYIPQHFAMYLADEWHGITAEDLKTLKQGPDAEWYWESWENVLNNATQVQGGHDWTLSHDCDLFAVRDDYEWEE